MNSNGSTPFRVLIVGAGVAGLEAACALRELAGERVATTVLAPRPDFAYRPMRVLEPFGRSRARCYALDELSDHIGVHLVQDAFDSLDSDRRHVYTEGGERLEYDALLLAPGAVPRRRFEHAVTLDDNRLDEQLHGLIQDIEGGYVQSLAFVAPSPVPWPLPLYELALLTARRAYDMNVEVAITLATPEEAPLAVFGAEASHAVERVLGEHGIAMLTSAYCETPAPRVISVHPGGRRLSVDRIVALPKLVARPLFGVPTRPNGFIAVDPRCRVPELQHVYAAGDAVDFPVKHGGIAAQQADAAAEAIAALAGAPVEPQPFTPIIHGVLLGAAEPLYLSADITGGHGSTSQISEVPTFSPASKIAARYLAPCLEPQDRTVAR